MATDTTGNSPIRKETWWAKQWQLESYKAYEWFRFLVLLLVGLVIFYLLLHRWIPSTAEYEYAKLDEKQIQQVNRIYFDSAAARLCDSLKTPNKECDACKRVIEYLRNEFSNKLDMEHVDNLRKYLCSSSSLEASAFLANVRFKVKSYFWLTGPEIYYEIAFWSVFGVLCSILFNLSSIMKNNTTDPKNPRSVFDSSELPYQVAKILYAPLCTLVIVLGYNFFSDQNIVDISSSKGILVFAFLGGFYSGRLISFMDRLKEVVLPLSGPADLPKNKEIQTSTIRDLIIELELSDLLEPEVKSEIAEIGLRGANVTLQNEEGGDPIKAIPVGEDQSSRYTVSISKPGTYTIQAAWSKELTINNTIVIVNLKGEKSQLLTSSETPIRLVMIKDDAEG